MSIVKGLFIGLKNQKVIPFNKMTPELHDQISSGLAKIMMAAKMSNAKLTKSQQNYIINQAKQVQEFEDRYITKIKDSAGNIIKKGKEKVADVFDLEGRTLDPSKTIMGGTQEGAAFKSGIMKATGAGPKKVITKGLPDKEFQDLRRSFRMNIAKNSQDFNQDLAKRIINRELYQDLSDAQRKDFLDSLDFVLKNPRGGSADGGRIGLKLGTNELRQMAMEMFGKDDLRLLSRDELDQLREAFDIKKGRVEEADGGRIGLAAGTMPNVIMRLVRGFMKMTGRKPNKDEMEKIIFEAADTDIGKMASDDYVMKVGGGLKAVKRRMDEIDRSKLSKMVDDIELAQGGRAGFKEGRIARILKSLKPFGSGNKFQNQLEAILYGETGLAEGLNLLSQSGLFAEGGRIGYKDGPKDPKRRTFIKAAAGLASLIPGLGIIGKGAKVAAPVVAKAAEITGPALAKLVETVMSAGKLISLTGTRVKNMVTKKKLGKVEVEEDIADGSYIIKKDGKEIYYKPGRMDESGIEDDIIEVIEDRLKKASGGIGYMLGE